jgi:hypothetical protein
MTPSGIFLNTTKRWGFSIFPNQINLTIALTILGHKFWDKEEFEHLRALSPSNSSLSGR